MPKQERNRRPRNQPIHRGRPGRGSGKDRSGSQRDEGKEMGTAGPAAKRTVAPRQTVAHTCRALDDQAAQQVFQGQQVQAGEQLDSNSCRWQPRQPEAQSTKEALKRAYSDKIERQLAEESTVGTRTRVVQRPVRLRAARSGNAMTCGGSWVVVARKVRRASRRPRGSGQSRFRIASAGYHVISSPRRAAMSKSRRGRSTAACSKQLTNFAWLLALVVATLCGWWLVQKLAAHAADEW